jgi:hypothetical protein
MGNDLLLASLSIRVGCEPDWDAARRQIPLLTDKQMESGLFDWLGGETPTIEESGELDRGECIKELNRLLDAVQEAVGSEHRHLYACTIVPGWTTYITGGDSWGDSPSEEFDLFNAFLDTGLADVAGFGREEA